MPLALVCYISCNPQAAREFPKNYLILFALTLCMGLTVSCTVLTVTFSFSSILFIKFTFV